MRMMAGCMTMIAIVFLHEPVVAQPQLQDLCYGKLDTSAPSAPPEALISSCTAVIQSGNRGDHDLAVAFTNRGVGYRQVLQYEHAFADFDQAIRLDPNYPLAYFQRGGLYLESGEIGRAWQDFDQAARLKRREAEFNVEEL
jgi:tetratricopeptide (TPR) repeat protein